MLADCALQATIETVALEAVDADGTLLAHLWTCISSMWYVVTLFNHVYSVARNSD